MTVAQKTYLCASTGSGVYGLTKNSQGLATSMTAACHIILPILVMHVLLFKSQLLLLTLL